MTNITTVEFYSETANSYKISRYSTSGRQMCEGTRDNKSYINILTETLRFPYPYELTLTRTLYHSDRSL